MTPDTIITLGEFAFSGLEIPEKITFGGRQQLAVHRLIGGRRVIDAMGADPSALHWSGLMFGATALQRARYLDTLRKSGQSIDLTWSEFRYTVIVASFDADFQRFYQIPYTLGLEVVTDQTDGVTSIADASVDTAISQDMATANGYAGSIGDGTLSGLMSTVNTAISAVSTFASAAQSTINSVLQPIAAVRARIGILQTSLNNTISNVTTVGGLIPGNSIARQSSALLGQINAATQTPNLFNLDRVLGHVSTNLGTINSGQFSVVTAGGNLFNIAAKQYGDASAWTALAKANKLTDPTLTGVQTIIVPPQNNQTGGVLSA